DHEPMVDEVEGDLEGDAARGMQPARGQATDVHIQGDVPPVVPGGARGHPHLADDLHPEVERLLRRLPGGQRKLGERHAPYIPIAWKPASPERRWAVTAVAIGETRKSAASATSSTVISRRSGERPAAASA